MRLTRKPRPKPTRSAPALPAERPPALAQVKRVPPSLQPPTRTPPTLDDDKLVKPLSLKFSPVTLERLARARSLTTASQIDIVRFAVDRYLDSLGV